MMIKALKDASLFPCIVNLPVSHTEDVWSMCPDYSMVHVLAALRNTQKHASVWAVSGICLLVLKQRQLLAPVALQHAFKDSALLNQWLVYGCKVPV